jgi:hypothetical protein
MRRMGYQRAAKRAVLRRKPGKRGRRGRVQGE